MESRLQAELNAGVTGGAYWLNDRFTHVFVSDSRIASDIVSVSSQVPGRVVSIAVRTGQAITWDPATEQIINNPEAAKMIGKAYRAPWKLG